MIFSDETMQYLNGSKAFKKVKEIYNEKNLIMLPYYLVTALTETSYDDIYLKVLQKPLVRFEFN